MERGGQKFKGEMFVSLHIPSSTSASSTSTSSSLLIPHSSLKKGKTTNF